MKGQRIHTRFGVSTNKSIKSNSSLLRYYYYKNLREIDSRLLQVEQPDFREVKVKLCGMCYEKKKLYRELHERNQDILMMKSSTNKNGQKTREEFKYQENQSCMNCHSMRTVKRAVADHQFEVIDKKEKKRLFYKYPEIFEQKYE